MNRLVTQVKPSIYAPVSTAIRGSIATVNSIPTRNMSSGERGSGAGKGGGSGGSIRDAGGAFGKQEAAREDQYFRQQSAEQLSKLKSALDSQIASHQKLIKEHQEAIDQAKKAIQDLEEKK